jgi:hypothetical protein
MQSAPTEKKTVVYLWEPFVRAIPLATAGETRLDADTDADPDTDMPGPHGVVPWMACCGRHVGYGNPTYCIKNNQHQYRRAAAPQTNTGRAAMFIIP